MRERPLSPHLSVYQWKYTIVTSILNRITGIILSIALLLLVYWLMAVASGAESYNRAQVVLSHGLAKVVYAGLVVSFAYHLLGGIRHLIWDTGRGLERRQAYRSSWILAAATVVLVLAFGYLVFGTGERLP